MFRRSLSKPQPYTIALGALALCTAVILTGAGPAQAALLLTEIHYNGPTAGLDPDEFVELTNSGDTAIDLGGYRFSRGIDFQFPAGTRLNARDSVVVVRQESGFRSVFADYAGGLFDFSGSLSNSGEILSLLTDSLSEVWSVSYDDSGAWPLSSDGGGDSLQLRASFTVNLTAEDWFGAPPTPGRWAGLSAVSAETPAQVSLPGCLALVGAGLAVLYRRIRPSPPRTKNPENAHKNV